MRRVTLIFAILVAFALVPFAGADHGPDDDDNGGRGTVWVVNRDRGEVAVFDAASGTLRATVPTGAGAHEIAIPARGRKAFVTNENDTTLGTEGTVSVLSTRTADHLGKVPLQPRPHHLEASRDGRTILVGLVGSNRVAALAARTGLVQRIDASSAEAAARAHGPYLARDTLYVAHEIGDEVTGIDARSGAILFSVGGILGASEVLPDGHERVLYVSARNADEVIVIDLATRAIAAEVPVGDQPETLLLTPDERTLIVSLRGTPAQLAFVDTRSLTLIGTVQVAGSGSFGDLAAMSPDGRLVYATFDRGAGGVGGVTVVDVRRRAVVGTWPYPGVGRPHGIAYARSTPR